MRAINASQTILVFMWLCGCGSAPTQAFDGGVDSGADAADAFTATDAPTSNIVIDSFTSDSPSITEGESVVLTALVRDSVGLFDIATVELEDADSTELFGAFDRGANGLFTRTLSWSDIQTAHLTDLALGGRVTRTFRARATDRAGVSVSATTSIDLTCGDNGACAGHCDDLNNDRHCGTCENQCNSNGWCEASTCRITDSQRIATENDAPSLAVDSLGNPRVAFGGRYEARAGGIWPASEIIPNHPLFAYGAVSSLAVDSTDASHVGLWSDEGGLSYATRGSAGWSEEVVSETTTPVLGTVDLLLDASDRPHIVYGNSDAHTLNYIARVGSVWEPEVIDTGVWVSTSSAQFGMDGYVRVAYVDESTSVLKLATRSTVGWSVETAPYLLEVSGTPSLAIAADGSVCITFYDASYGDLIYAELRAGTWHFSSVDESDDVGRHSSLITNGTERRVTYYDATHGHLKYAFNVDGRWRTHDVTPHGYYEGEFNTLAAGPDGRLFMAYTDAADLAFTEASWVH